MLFIMEHCQPRFAKTSEELVRDLVFKDNGYKLPKDAVFGVPNAYAPIPGDRSRRDTWVDVHVPRHWWQRDRGAVKLFYRRYNLDMLKLNPQKILALPTETFTLFSVLPQINAYYDTLLSEDDVMDATWEPGPGPFVMVAQSGSLAWEGEVNVAFTIPMSMVITQPNLTGFSQYQPSA
jgi:hypothetical protein